MKKLLLGLLLVGSTCANAQISVDGSVKGSYNSTWLFNKNISDQGTEQDYAMGWGSNYGVGASVYYGVIGLGIEFLRGSHTGGYAGDFLGKYNSNVKLNMTQIPLLLKLKSENGGYIELGASVNNISKATYTFDYTDSDIFDGSSNETSNYSKSYTSVILGFGANVKLIKAIPLSLNVGMRLQYGLTDAKGVDALGNNLSNSLLYSTYEKTNAASGGIMLGLNYTFGGKK
ncbi:MAG: hypothetical protein RLZ10_1068 [Bacteroidota bacterium]|jgi:hypothetical protein